MTWGGPQPRDAPPPIPGRPPMGLPMASLWPLRWGMRARPSRRCSDEALTSEAREDTSSVRDAMPSCVSATPDSMRSSRDAASAASLLASSVTPRAPATSWRQAATAS